MTGHEKLAKILKTIEEGHTVYFKTICKSIPVHSKTLESFAKRDCELFKSTDTDVLIRQGGRYVSTSGCRITFK